MSRILACCITILATVLLHGTGIVAQKEHKRGLAVPVDQQPEFVTIRARRLAERNDLDITRHDQGAVYRLYDWTIGNELYRTYQDPRAVFGPGAYPFVVTEVCLPMHFSSAGRITLAAEMTRIKVKKQRRAPGEHIAVSRPREIRIPHPGPYMIYIPLDTPRVVLEPFFAGVFIHNTLSPKDSVALFLDHAPIPQSCFNYWGSPEVWVDMNDTSFCNLPGRLVLFAAGRPHSGVRPSVSIRPPRDTAVFLCQEQTIRLPVTARDQNRRQVPVSIAQGPGYIAGDHWEFATTTDTTFTVVVTAGTGAAADTADFHVAVRLNRNPWSSLPEDTTIITSPGASISWPLPLGDTDRNLYDVYLADGPGAIIDNTWHLPTSRLTSKDYRLVVRASDFCRAGITDTVTVHLDILPTVAAVSDNRPEEPEHSRFDLDRSGSVNMLDLQYLVSFILLDSPAPPAGPEACDIDRDGALTVADIAALRKHLFPTKQTER